MTDPADPSPPHLHVVSLHDPGGVLERVEREAPRARFAPIADIARGGAAGYEVLLTIGEEDAASPSAWTASVGVQAAPRLEARLVQAALQERERLPSGASLAVNVSAAGLRTPEVRAALRDAGQLSDVVVMVTEDAAEDTDGVVAAALEAVREAGGRIGVDETGSGYASLRQLVDLRPDYVRVGAEFVAGIDGDQAKGAVVEAVASLAARTGARLIAGGVPGRPELTALRRMGVPLAQGPLFGAPTAVMGQLPPGAADAIRRATPPVRAADTVADLIEARPALSWGASIEEIADEFLADPANDVIVLVDESARPLAMAERIALMRGESYERPVMRISPSSPQKAVARRAAARPWMERYHPLVACDRRGVYLGLVRIEQLLDALAQD